MKVSYFWSLLLMLLVGACRQRMEHRFAKSFELMPAAELLLEDSSTMINTKAITKDLPVVITYVSCDCEHCQAQAQALSGNARLLTGVRLLLVTNSPPTELREFCKVANVRPADNFVAGSDLGFKLYGALKIKQYPSTYIYDERGQFLKLYLGEVDVRRIIETLKATK